MTSTLNDQRNVINRYKGVPMEQIINDLDAHGSALEIAIDNVEKTCVPREASPASTSASALMDAGLRLAF